MTARENLSTAASKLVMMSFVDLDYSFVFIKARISWIRPIGSISARR